MLQGILGIKVTIDEGQLVHANDYQLQHDGTLHGHPYNKGQADVLKKDKGGH